MAFLETRAATAPRTVLQAAGICQITLAGTVFAGDCLGIDTATWVLSASATAEQPLLVALTDGYSGDVIDAAMMVVVEVTTTATNVATALGQLVCLDDNGLYKADTAEYPDVGFVTSIGADSLSAVLYVCPLMAQLTVVRA